MASQKAFAAALVILSLRMKKTRRVRELALKAKPRKRRIWVKDWVNKREKEGFYSKLMKELRDEDPKMYTNFIRMGASDFEFLLSLVSPIISKKDTHLRKSIPPGERLAVTLRFLASGDSYTSLSLLFRIPKNTISLMVPEVCDALYEVLNFDYLKVPSTEAEWNIIAKQFEEKWNIPNCIGSLDGKHIVMKAPRNSGSEYFNYKKTHSIVLMALCDADYKFTFIDVGAPGRCSDGGVFNNCKLANALDENTLNIPPPKALPGRELTIPHVIVADDAFALKPNVMKPLAQRPLTMVQRVYNYRISRARRVIENVFGILAARFRVFHRPIALDPDKTKKVVLASCVLHNFLMTRKESRRRYCGPGYTDVDQDGVQSLGQ